MKEMLSFTGSLRTDSEAFSIFITEKYAYKDKKKILPNNVVQKIDSFLAILKVKNREEEVLKPQESLCAWYQCYHERVDQIL